MFRTTIFAYCMHAPIANTKNEILGIREDEFK